MLQAVGGFRGEGAFAYALEEGGERNGVLTAVEDFLAGRDDLELRRIPAIFGVGVVFAARRALRRRRCARCWTRCTSTRCSPAWRPTASTCSSRCSAPATSCAPSGPASTRLIAGLERELEAEKAENARLRLEAAVSPPRPPA